MPCGYDYNAYYWTRQPWGLWPWTSVLKDPTFQRRLEWIGNCASIRGGYLHHFDYIKANTSRYLFEVFVVEAPKRFPWGWGTAAFELPFHSCYFLGSYPNYWDVVNKKIVYAHEAGPGEQILMANKPTIPDTFLADVQIQDLNAIETDFGKQNLRDYLYPERIPAGDPRLTSPTWLKTQERIAKAVSDQSIFFDEFDVKNYLMQKEPLDARTARFLACKAKMWPKTPREIKPLPPPPAAPEQVTTTPMDEIPLPIPETTPGAPVPAGSIGLGSDISFRIKPTGYTNTLELTLTIYQRLV